MSSRLVTFKVWQVYAPHPGSIDYLVDTFDSESTAHYAANLIDDAYVRPVTVSTALPLDIITDMVGTTTHGRRYFTYRGG